MKSEKKPYDLFIKDPRILILFLILIPWAYLFYKLENHIYPFFIIIFFITCLYYFRSKKLNYSILIIPIIFLIFINTKALDAFDKMKSTIALFSRDPMSSFNELLMPNSGLQLIEEPLGWMNSKILEYELKNYKLSPNLGGDEVGKQTLIEIAWPAKFESESKNMFLENDEIDSFPLCTLIDHNLEYSLVQCP